VDIDWLSKSDTIAIKVWTMPNNKEISKTTIKELINDEDE
jgi:hypothetical protein